MILVTLEVRVPATIYPTLTVSRHDWEEACAAAERGQEVEVEGVIGGRGSRAEKLTGNKAIRLTGPPNEDGSWPAEFSEGGALSFLRDPACTIVPLDS